MRHGVLFLGLGEVVIDWVERAERIRRHTRLWAGGPWECRRAATRTVDAHLTRRMLRAGQVLPAGWNCSDFLMLVREGEA